MVPTAQGSLSPILIRGSLHCPHCRTPLTVEERGENDYRCIYCFGRVGKLTDKTIIQMAKAIPKETMREWAREAKIYSSMK
ncbi:MAG: hypothetical protein ACYCPW_07410 [Nitrososphaerales archaeon]